VFRARVTGTGRGSWGCRLAVRGAAVGVATALFRRVSSGELGMMRTIRYDIAGSVECRACGCAIARSAAPSARAAKKIAAISELRIVCSIAGELVLCRGNDGATGAFRRHENAEFWKIGDANKFVAAADLNRPQGEIGPTSTALTTNPAAPISRPSRVSKTWKAGTRRFYTVGDNQSDWIGDSDIRAAIRPGCCT